MAEARAHDELDVVDDAVEVRTQGGHVVRGFQGAERGADGVELGHCAGDDGCVLGDMADEPRELVHDILRAVRELLETHGGVGVSDVGRIGQCQTGDAWTRDAGQKGFQWALRVFVLEGSKCGWYLHGGHRKRWFCGERERGIEVVDSEKFFSGGLGVAEAHGQLTVHHRHLPDRHIAQSGPAGIMITPYHADRDTRHDIQRH